MKKKFSCPNCGQKQAVKKVWAVRHNNSWQCKSCKHEIKPIIPRNYGGYYGFLAGVLVIFPTLYINRIYDLSFWQSMGIALIFGLIGLVIALSHIYYTTWFEGVEK